ncbi:MAG: NIL domain-containing protein [Candidatus Omnitrophota bacterium]
MAKRMIKLTFMGEAVKKPLTFRMAKRYDVVPNIRRARVTDKVGEIVLELDGKEADLQKGIKFLTRSGVIVEPVVGDIVE